MSKSITATIVLFLLCLQDWNTAQAAKGPLDGIGSQLIASNFPLDTAIDVGVDSTESQKIDGCFQVKTFEIVGAGASGQVVVAMCKDGKFSPSNIDATLAKWVADSKDTFKYMPPHVAQFMLAGADPVPVALVDGKQGKAMTLPAVGHGFALIPLAYARTAEGDASIVVQAYLDPNNPRNRTEPIAVLLQGIYKGLQQKKN